MKKLNKIISLICATAAVSMLLCSCGSSGKSLADVQKAGKLVVATSPDFPPFEYLEDGEVVGIEVDILQNIADELGVELEIQQMDFDSVIPGVQAGKFDVGMSGITVTETRLQNADFTDPYFMASQAIVVTKDSTIQSKADLTGKKISAQTGTTAEDFCMKSGYEVQAFTANNDAAAALSTGKVDAWVVDNEVALALAAQQDLVVLPEAMTSEPYAYAFQKNGDLCKAVNDIQAEMLADGTIQQIFEAYNTAYVAPQN